MTNRRSRGQRKPWKRGDRVLVYIRVSKVGKRQSTLISDDVQEDVCRQWAQREGLVIIAQPVSDIDKSGREITKRQITSSIERVRSGEADGIVVWKVSRWGRNLIDSMLNVRDLHDAGGFIASATESLDDIETPMGRFSLTQMLAIAQLQSDQIGETWVNIQDYRIGRGLPRSGKTRWGYLKNEIGRDDDPSTAYTIDPVVGPWLKRCFEEFNTGRTLTSIVKDLRRNGIKTAQGNDMSYSTLRKLMDSGFAAGLLVDRRDVEHNSSGSPRTTNPNDVQFVPGAHPAIIDMKVWENYVKRRAEHRPPRESAVAHRLSGLVCCGSCGRKLISLWEKRSTPEPYRQYKCFYTKNNANSTSFCRAPVVIKQSFVEDEVFRWLNRHARGEDDYAEALERLSQAEHTRADLAIIQREIEERTNLRKAHLDNKANAVDDEERREIDDRRAELKREINTLQQRRNDAAMNLSAPSIPAADAFDALAAIWTHAELELINGAVRSVVKKVYVDRSLTGRGSRYSTGEGRVRVVGVWEDDPGPANPRTT